MSEKKDGLITYLNNCVDLTAKDINRGDNVSAIKHLEAALMALADTIKTERESSVCISDNHLFQYTGQATAAGQLMICERCGKRKTESWK